MCVPNSLNNSLVGLYKMTSSNLDGMLVLLIVSNPCFAKYENVSSCRTVEAVNTVNLFRKSYVKVSTASFMVEVR
jgi:hypothetical protein